MKRRILIWLASLGLGMGLALGLALGAAAAPPPGPAAACAAPTGSSAALPSLQALGITRAQVPSADPPRISLAAFKALYDDPAKRPLILDVRAPDSYAAGHIPGAISFPEADVDARAGELPKNQLIVAYCQ